MEPSINIPNPDPSVLTTQALLREIAMLRDVIETRLDGYDKAIELIQSSADKVPSKVDIAVKQLQELHAEKFQSIEIQFRERDTRTEQTSRDSKVAVDAALQAAKEAVGEQNKSNTAAINKMETSFTKQIDQIAMLISASNKSTDEKVSDIKDRLTGIETRRVTTDVLSQTGKTDMRGNWGYVFGAIAAIGMIVTVIVAMLRSSPAH
jgi:hypothetical protein